MPITSINKDAEALTLTVTADFAAPVARLWNAYTDPRQLERFWGPESWPATFTRHDVTPGGRSRYVMTGPDGDQSAGYWEWLQVDPGRSFEVRDGFAGPDGDANPEMPNMRMVFAFEPTDQGSRLTTTTWFNSADELQQLLDMGMEEGMKSAMGQIDDVLADLQAFAAEAPTQLQRLGDHQARTSRVVRGTLDQVWAAHHDPALLKKWMLGPDGWSLPVAEVATEVGQTYRYEWKNDASGEQFGFTGEALEIEKPYRSVTTERMIGTDGPSTTNELSLVAVDGGTLVTIVITYPDTETREMILGTGMVDGMETGYARLDQVLAA
ncbi:SRPBCC family protein [Propionibacteriaceae bacterium G1746]|uniref:SRPBCC family protein n=1 Tax=Aestuariimicrobium sp. G57 TaxID=3418485 RepID=UPI003C1BEFFB